MNRKTVLAASIPALLAAPVQAHVKWLHEPGLAALPPVAPFRLSDPVVLLGIELVCIALLAAAHFNRASETATAARRLERLGRNHWSLLHRIVGLLLGMSLLRCAFDGALLAPHLSGSGPVFEALRVVEAGSGLLFVAGTGMCAAAAALFVVCAGVLFLFGGVSFLEYAALPGIAIFLSASCLTHWRLHRLHRLVVMRVLLGVSLCTLAFTEKLLQPQMAVELLAQYPFNFMQALGLEYPDRLFILSAGCAELVFGLCFALGLATRLNALALAVFLVASNSYFFAAGNFQGALLEASGHAPLFAALSALLLFGNGRIAMRRGFGALRHGGAAVRDRSLRLRRRPRSAAAAMQAPATAA
ncbi:MAG: DoxX family membrane protein [Pseudomonadota bacterium]|nr:DoxX family membrane protein [Pseudomonadota bacterium]